MGNELFNICDCCGVKDNIAKGIMHHTFGGYAGYGSAYDGDFITLVICSDCLDAMIKARKKTDTDEQKPQR